MSRLTIAVVELEILVIVVAAEHTASCRRRRVFIQRHRACHHTVVEVGLGIRPSHETGAVDGRRVVNAATEQAVVESGGSGFHNSHEATMGGISIARLVAVALDGGTAPAAGDVSFAIRVTYQGRGKLLRLGIHAAGNAQVLDGGAVDLTEGCYGFLTIGLDAKVQCVAVAVEGTLKVVLAVRAANHPTYVDISIQTVVLVGIRCIVVCNPVGQLVPVFCAGYRVGGFSRAVACIGRISALWRRCQYAGQIVPLYQHGVRGFVAPQCRGAGRHIKCRHWTVQRGSGHRGIVLPAP